MLRLVFALAAITHLAANCQGTGPMPDPVVDAGTMSDARRLWDGLPDPPDYEPPDGSKADQNGMGSSSKSPPP